MIAAPIGEVVALGPLDSGGQRVGAGQDQALAGVYDLVDAAADKTGAPLEHADPGRPIGRSGIDVVVAGLQ